MGKSHPLALRSRVIAFVEDGHSNRAAARHFRVSPRFVNNLVKLKRATGSLAPRRQGHLGGGKLNAHGDWVRERLAENGDLTLDELCAEFAERGVVVHRSNVGRLLHRLGLSHKKSLQVHACGQSEGAEVDAGNDQKLEHSAANAGDAG